MRIALVVHGFPPHECSGVETHVAALAKCLARRNLEVEVFAPRSDPRLPEFAQRSESRDGYRVTWIAVNQRPRSAQEHLDPPGMAAAFGEFLGRARPSLVHFQHVLKLGVGVLEETARRAIPSIYTAHDFFPICHRVILARPDLTRCSTVGDSRACARCDSAVSYLNAKQRWSDYHAGVLPATLVPEEQRELAELLEDRGRAASGTAALEARSALDRRRKQAFDRLDLVLAPTEFLRERLLEGGFDPRRVESSACGIELSNLASLQVERRVPGEPLTFGFIGGALKHKGVHVLIEAFSKLAPRARLTIHADSTDREYVNELRARAQQVGAQWRGAFPASELPRVLSEIDVLVVPSIWWENAPFAIREAQAAHRPVIASDTPALRESVRDGVDGLLVECGSVASLATAMKRVVEEPRLLETLAANTRPPRSIEDQADELCRRYSTLVNASRRALPPEIPASARDFARRVLELESCTVDQLALRASAGLAALARALGVDAIAGEVADPGELALEHLRDARLEIAWRAARNGSLAAELESERELRAATAAELARSRQDGERAQESLLAAQAALAHQEKQLEASASAQTSARAALESEQRAHAQARSALDLARQALEESLRECARGEEQLRVIGVAREELRGELSRARNSTADAQRRLADLERAHAALTQGFSSLERHAQWLERESAALARRVGHGASVLKNGTDFSAAQAEFDLFERELAWRRKEMQAARDDGGALLRAIVQHSGLGRRLRGWEVDA